MRATGSRLSRCGLSLVALVAAISLLFGAAPAGAASAAGGHLVPRPLANPAAASPTVTGPVTGGNGAAVLYGTTFDLSQVGYQQSEYFVSGTASYYQPQGALGSDGQWTVTPTGSAPYTTRMVVDRPQDPNRFNGTVVVEWINVAAGFDLAPIWLNAHNELIRDGFAWVGISAQAAGVNDDKAQDPVRYAALSHPGDSYAYDIFSQAGQAVWDSAARVLGGLHPSKVLATGESLSADWLTTYVDAVHPLVDVYDGYLVEGRGGPGAPLSQAPQPDVPGPSSLLIRTDMPVPVLTVEAETDLFTLGYLASRQDDSAHFRLWEVAGAAHSDTYQPGLGPSDTGDGSTDVQTFNLMLNPPTQPIPGIPTFQCASPINTGEHHYVIEGALYALSRWATLGLAPTQAPRLQMSGGSFVLDANGNVLGGVRTPSVDVPVATLSGLGQTGQPFCTLFGTTVAFSAAKLASLYPSHAQFVAHWSIATVLATAAGYIRPADAVQLIAAALASTVGA